MAQLNLDTRVTITLKRLDQKDLIIQGARVTMFLITVAQGFLNPHKVNLS